MDLVTIEFMTLMIFDLLLLRGNKKGSLSRTSRKLKIQFPDKACHEGLPEGVNPRDPVI